MPKEPLDVRLHMMITRSEEEAIDAWRYGAKVPSRSEAVRRLVAIGLQAEPLLRQLLAWIELSPTADEVQASIKDLRKMLEEAQ